MGNSKCKGPVAEHAWVGEKQKPLRVGEPREKIGERQEPVQSGGVSGHSKGVWNLC